MQKRKTGLVGLFLARTEFDKKDRQIRAEIFTVRARIGSRQILLKRLTGIEVDPETREQTLLPREELVTGDMREISDTAPASSANHS